MAGMAGQAVGMAVGAAVGSIIPGVGTFAGASIGGSIGGMSDTWSTSGTQSKLEAAAIKLNQAQYHAKASAEAAIHAENFRQALASQVAISSMRGGSGSLGIQFGNQAYRTFVEDQQAIEAGVKVADVQSQIGLADSTARRDAARTASVSQLISSFNSINLNAPRTK